MCGVYRNRPSRVFVGARAQPTSGANVGHELDANEPRFGHGDGETERQAARDVPYGGARAQDRHAISIGEHAAATTSSAIEPARGGHLKALHAASECVLVTR